MAVLRMIRAEMRFYRSTLDRIDEMIRAWSRVDGDKKSEKDVMLGAVECCEALCDVLGDYRERVARMEGVRATPGPLEMLPMEITCFDGSLLAVTDGEDNEYDGRRIMTLEVFNDDSSQASLRVKDVRRLSDWATEWLQRNR